MFVRARRGTGDIKTNVDRIAGKIVPVFIFAVVRGYNTALAQRR